MTANCYLYTYTPILLLRLIIVANVAIYYLGWIPAKIEKKIKVQLRYLIQLSVCLSTHFGTFYIPFMISSHYRGTNHNFMDSKKDKVRRNECSCRLILYKFASYFCIRVWYCTIERATIINFGSHAFHILRNRFDRIISSVSYELWHNCCSPVVLWDLRSSLDNIFDTQQANLHGPHEGPSGKATEFPTVCYCSVRSQSTLSRN